MGRTKVLIISAKQEGSTAQFQQTQALRKTPQWSLETLHSIIDCTHVLSSCKIALNDTKAKLCFNIYITFFFPPRTRQKLQLGLVPCLSGTLQANTCRETARQVLKDPSPWNHHELKGLELYVNSSKVLSFWNSEASCNSASAGTHRSANGCCFPFEGHSLLSEARKEEKTVAWRKGHGLHESYLLRVSINQSEAACWNGQLYIHARKLKVTFAKYRRQKLHWRLWIKKQKKEAVSPVCEGQKHIKVKELLWYLIETFNGARIMAWSNANRSSNKHELWMQHW